MNTLERSMAIRIAAATVAAVVIAPSASMTFAQIIQSKPPAAVQGADITEKRGASAPLDLHFTNADGRDTTLGAYFDGKHPVVLTFAYFNCPLLCPLVLGGAEKAFKGLDLTLGADYRALTVSIDHHDTFERALDERTTRLYSYDRAPGSPDEAWDFLVGKPRPIRKLASSVGFGFNFFPKTGQFAHSAGMLVLTPTGEVSNYLYGVEFDPQQLRLALLDAGNGKVGSLFDRIVLYCHVYDPDAGSYSLQVMRVMQVAGGATVLVLGSLLGALFIGEGARRKKRARKAYESTLRAGVAQTSEHTELGATNA